MLEIVHKPELKTSFSTGTATILRPVEDDDLVDLQAILNNHASADPYQASAAYFAMTGRDGLWLVRDEDASVLVCRHPNVRNEFLVFPPIGQNGIGLLAKTIAAISKTGVKVSLARADETVAKKLSALHSEIRMECIPEKLLDWAYPVHVLNTAKVTQHRGNEFQQFRTKLNKIDHKRIQAFDFDPAIHRQAAVEVVSKWSQGDAEKNAPYMRMLDLFQKMPLAGRIIFHDDQPAGFSLWEETSPKSGLANAYAHLGLHEVGGMSRYVMLDMCQTLQHKGFARVCIGGSETAGLDQFKRQLRPVQSVPLGVSWRITSLEPQLRANPVLVNGSGLKHSVLK